MRRISEIATFPAPIGGLNVADSLVGMGPQYATVLKNMVTQPYGVELRAGNVRHATGLGGPVETVVTHIPATSGDAFLFAFAEGDMFDVTDPGDATRVAIITGLTNNVWNGMAVSNASGFNTTLYNGVDDGIWIKDDGTVARITAAAVPASPVAGEISGVDPADLIGGTVHQKRTWLIEKDTTKGWYLAPEAIFGIATMFDFGAIFTRGGYLAALATWTVDSGAGMDDLLVAVSSRGDVVIYKGTDPSDAATWALIGVFSTGQPMDMRAITKVEGDLVLLTKFGLLSLSDAMARSATAAAVSEAYLSTKVQYLLNELCTELVAEFGWAVNYWPDTNLIVVNIPLDEGGSGQLVQSTITKGWSQLDGWDAISWTLFGSQPVYGDRDGNVWRAWEGTTDNSIQSDALTISVGNAIYGTAQTAFNYLDSKSVVKHAKMIRPTFVTADAFDYSVAVNPDFSYTAPLTPGTEQGAIRSLWDTAVWGSDIWNTHESSTHHHWASVSGIGSAFAVRLSFQLATRVLWASYDLMYENGDGI